MYSSRGGHRCKAARQVEEPGEVPVEPVGNGIQPCGE